MSGVSNLNREFESLLQLSSSPLTAEALWELEQDGCDVRSVIALSHIVRIASVSSHGDPEGRLAHAAHHCSLAG